MSKRYVNEFAVSVATADSSNNGETDDELHMSTTGNLGGEKSNSAFATTSATSCRGKEKFITPRLCHALDNWKVSDGAATHIIIAATDALGHSIDELVVNRSTIHRARQKYRAQRAGTIANFDVISSIVV